MSLTLIDAVPLTSETIAQRHFFEIMVQLSGIVANGIGILIDVYIVVGGYFFMLRYRRQLAARLGRIKLLKRNPDWKETVSSPSLMAKKISPYVSGESGRAHI